jgi:hypothetical protein
MIKWIKTNQTIAPNNTSLSSLKKNTSLSNKNHKTHNVILLKLNSSCNTISNKTIRREKEERKKKNQA